MKTDFLKQNPLHLLLCVLTIMVPLLWQLITRFFEFVTKATYQDGDFHLIAAIVGGVLLLAYLFTLRGITLSDEWRANTFFSHNRTLFIALGMVWTFFLYAIIVETLRPEWRTWQDVEWLDPPAIIAGIVCATYLFVYVKIVTRKNAYPTT